MDELNGLSTNGLIALIVLVAFAAFIFWMVLKD